jgi:hypothetical protein
VWRPRIVPSAVSRPLEKTTLKDGLRFVHGCTALGSWVEFIRPPLPLAETARRLFQCTSYTYHSHTAKHNSSPSSSTTCSGGICASSFSQCSSNTARTERCPPSATATVALSVRRLLGERFPDSGNVGCDSGNVGRDSGNVGRDSGNVVLRTSLRRPTHGAPVAPVHVALDGSLQRGGALREGDERLTYGSFDTVTQLRTGLCGHADARQ